MKQTYLRKKVIELNPHKGLDESKITLLFYEDSAVIITHDCFDDVSNRYKSDKYGLEKIRRLIEGCKEIEKHLL